ncbi:MAG: sugar transferase [Bryobacteraceae bacterium]
MFRLFRVFIPTSVLVLLVSEVLLVTGSYLLASRIVLEEELTPFLYSENGWFRMGLVVASVILGLHLTDLYRRIRVIGRLVLLQDLCQVLGIALLAQGLISYAFPPLRLGRGSMLVGSSFALVLLFAWRLFYSAYIVRVVGLRKILFVGYNQLVQEIADHIIEQPDRGFEIAGYLADEQAQGKELTGGTVLGAVGQVRRIAEEVRPGLIVVGLTERRARMPLQDLLELRFAGFAIQESGTAYEAVLGRISTKELRPSQLIFTEELGPRRGALALQSLMNFSISLVGAISLLPVMLLVAILVKLTSRGPVLYRQTRVGRNGRLFVVYKFRSMRSDAESLTGAVWAQPNDPRITPLGRWLRRLRLDELPQFFNVLRGEMSLVGPRPERPEFVNSLAERIPYYRQRHCVRPGITGWAQINHKYGDSVEDVITKLEYDLYYIKHVSPSLDAYILFQTIKTILLTRGAQ